MGTRRIAKVDDFGGSKVRIAPEMGKILEEYGATLQSMPVPDSLAAMKSGTIDVIVLPPFAFVAYNIPDVARYMTENISLGSPLCYLAVSQKAWDALPARVQEVMLGLRQPTVAQYEALFAQEDAGNIAAFKQKGVELVAFSAVDRIRLVAKAIKYWQIWVDEREKRGLKAREVFEFTQAKIREYTRK
jgi:TRAP-type C4-dicarboxylate transport system substrate-binding protein